MRVLVLDGPLCKRIRSFVTSCFSPGWIPVAHCRQHSWRYSNSQGMLSGHSCKGNYKRSKRRPLVARVCQVPDPSMTLYVIMLQQPEDKFAFEAWKRFCCQLLLARGQSKGKSVDHFKFNYFILFLQRLPGWPDFNCDLLDTDTKFLDDC